MRDWIYERKAIIMNNKMYKSLILSDKDTCQNIIKKIQIPSSVFKYRCFCRETNKGIEEDLYWKESVNGIVFCSLAKDFNRNDPEDCKLEYNENAIRDTLCKQLGYSGKRSYQLVKLIDDNMNKYISSIRDNFRIGCFTTNTPEEQYMWEDSNFGGNHTGYCIEYDTSKETMFPGEIIFLPILYDTVRYDSTKVICNLIKNNGSVVSLDVIALAYNFSLIKMKKYVNEKEWRLLVTNNKYADFFNVDKKMKVNFSNIMKGIYLGKNYKKYDANGEKYNYVLNICKLKNLPLFEMIEINGKLMKKCVYTPVVN